MYKTISNAIIRKFHPCYDPSKVIKDETEELTVKEWVEKYRSIVPAKDIVWLLLREEFMSEKDLILFVVRCAREALKLVENPDERSVNACNVAERYANGEATKEELLVARDAAEAAYDAVDIGAYTVANDTVNISASTAASIAALDVADAAYNASAHAASYVVAHNAYTAAFYTAYASDAVAHAASYVASYAVAHNDYTAAFYTAYASYAVAHAAYIAASYASDAANDAHAAQLDQLLTYFE
jgi:hypothetical protein